jgi:hypothetical protein
MGGRMGRLSQCLLILSDYARPLQQPMENILNYAWHHRAR